MSLASDYRRRFAVLASLFAISISFNACGSKQNANGFNGVGTRESASTGIGSGDSTPLPQEPTACLQSLPELRVDHFETLADAVGAFSRAAQKCAASRGQIQAFARKMENQGVRIIEME